MLELQIQVLYFFYSKVKWNPKFSTYHTMVKAWQAYFTFEIFQF